MSAPPPMVASIVAIRARQVAEDLAEHYATECGPHLYERARRMARTDAERIDARAATAMLRLHRRIVGDRR